MWTEDESKPPQISQPVIIDQARLETITLVLAGIALFGIIDLGLLSALLPGRLVYLVVRSAVPMFRRLGLTRRVGAAIVLLLLAGVIGVALAFGAIEAIKLLTTGSDSVVALLQQMADVVSTARERTPAWAHDYLPSSMQELESAAAKWLREHAGQIGTIGQGFGKFLFHVLIGIIIGGLLAFYRGQGDGEMRPMARAMAARVSMLSIAFRNVVFSQIRISALNTTLTR